MKKKVEKSPKISILLTELDKKVNPKLVYYFSFLIRSGDIIFFNNKDAEKYLDKNSYYTAYHIKTSDAVIFISNKKKVVNNVSKTMLDFAFENNKKVVFVVPPRFDFGKYKPNIVIEIDVDDFLNNSNYDFTSVLENISKIFVT